jgi:hypothetical protein
MTNNEEADIKEFLDGVIIVPHLLNLSWPGFQTQSIL